MNSNSQIVGINTFVRDPIYNKQHNYHTFEQDFLNFIKNSGKNKQIDIIKMQLNDGLQKLSTEKKYLFDIIFIDSPYDHKNILYKIIIIE